MDIMGKIDMENQMTVLQDAGLEEGEQSTNDEVEDLSNRWFTIWSNVVFLF